MLRLLYLVLLCLVSTVQVAEAHRQGERYVYLNVGEDSLSGRFEITLDHLAEAIDMPVSDGAARGPEDFEAVKDAAYDLLANSIEFTINGREYKVDPTRHEFLPVGFGVYALVHFDTAVSETLPEEITVTRNPVVEQAMAARGGPQIPVFLLIETNERTGLEGNEARHALIFGPGRDSRALSLAVTPTFEIFTNFVRYGVRHILIGYDHLLFLLALLFPAVLILREGGGWRPAESLREVFTAVLAIVTLFTIAHSVTLSLAALGIVRLPESLIESLIALSIAAAAAANLLGAPRRSVWVVIFALGLLHGLGFANVLSPYGVEPANVVTTLLGFNIGVELGQVAFVCVCVPILFLLRRSRFYAPVILKGGSVALIAIALYWFVERAFGVNMSISSMLG